MLLHHLSMMDHQQLLPYTQDMSVLCQTMWQRRFHRICGYSEGELDFYNHHNRLDTGCLQFVAGLYLGLYQDSVRESTTLENI